MEQDVGFFRSHFPRGERDRRKIGVMAASIALSIGILAFMDSAIHIKDGSLMVASFGATAVLAYAAPDSPLARPKNIFFGHLVSAVTGVAVVYLFGSSWWTIALAVTLAIVIMDQVGVLHPPGGATALWCAQTGATYINILAPVMIGVVIMLAVWAISQHLRERIDSMPAQEGKRGDVPGRRH